jgi:SNF2 family DNA or RNA helicase
MKQIYLKDTHIILDTPYNPDEIQALKDSFPTARWDKINKVWRIPVSETTRLIEFCQAWGINIDNDLIKLQIPNHPIGKPSIRLKTDKLIITLPYETLKVDQLKNIAGIKWDTTTNKWIAPKTSIHDIIDWANKFEIPIPEHIQEHADIEKQQDQHAINLSKATDANINIPKLKLNLYPYQKAGVAYAADKQRTFIADEMGLGKSLQSLAVTEHTNQYPALIVCPSSLQHDWENKIKEALPHRTTTHIQGRKETPQTQTDYTIIGYPNLNHHKTGLTNNNYQTLILDESHYCKNRTAQRTKAAKHIAKNIPKTGNILLLTGTPITNRPAEYAPQLEIIGQLDKLGGLWNFYKRYCGAYKDQWGHWQTHGASNLTELHNNLRKNCYIRREKEDVLPDLPPITYNTIHATLDNKHKKQYNQALHDLQEWYKAECEQLAIKEGRNPDAARIKAHFAAQNNETLIQLTALRQITANAKIQQAIEWINNANEQGLKIVIAAHHRNIVQTIANETGGLKIIGGQNPKETETAKHKFTTDPKHMNITISITAAAHGHTLNAAHNMLIIEPPWTPAHYQQTTARIHRIGQTQPVTIHNLIIPGTIDTHVHNTIQTKIHNTHKAITDKPDPTKLINALTPLT